MKTLKILRYDIKYGILKKYAYYICGILIAAVSCLELNNRISLLKRDVNIKGSEGNTIICSNHFPIVQNSDSHHSQLVCDGTVWQKWFS